MKNGYKPLSLAPWVGSKFQVSSLIIPYIPDEMFCRWCEPFGGVGGMLLAKRRWAECEIWNDRHGELFNVWKVIQTRYDEFLDTQKFEIKSRDVFAYLLGYQPKNDVERAQRFVYLAVNSFGGHSGHFTLNQTCPMSEKLQRLYRRIRRVVFENLDFADFFERYRGFRHRRISGSNPGRPFWFIDPPYAESHNAKQYDETGFDHEKLAECCRNLGSELWLQTNTDCQYIRDLYRDYCIVPFSRPVHLENRCGRDAAKKYHELMIANYDLNEVYKQNTTKGQQTLWTD